MWPAQADSRQDRESRDSRLHAPSEPCSQFRLHSVPASIATLRGTPPGWQTPCARDLGHPGLQARRPRATVYRRARPRAETAAVPARGFTFDEPAVRTAPALQIQRVSVETCRASHILDDECCLQHATDYRPLISINGHALSPMRACTAANIRRHMSGFRSKTTAARMRTMQRPNSVDSDTGRGTRRT